MSSGLIITSYLVIAALSALVAYCYANMPKRAAKAKDKPKPKKLEFTQKVIIVLAVLTVVFISLSYILAFLGKETVEGLSTSLSGWLFSLDGVVVLIYGVQNCVRAFSADKYLQSKTDVINEEEDEEETVG